ncbi:MAG: MMPL family transporter [Holophagaceae bacterium]|nr:MMPL family transporter [Holophagaceae bacterium]
MLNRLLRALLRLHLAHPRRIVAFAALLTAVLGWGALRVERRLDLMSLLPTSHPIVRASLEAGVGQQELLWLVAEGDSTTIEARGEWAENLVGRLLDQGTLPLNGLSGEGRLSGPQPVPGPQGVSLWPPLLAAGSLLDGDAAVGRLITEQMYALAPALLGDRLAPLRNPAEVERRLKETAATLASPNPIQARFAQLDPLNLRNLVPPDQESMLRATSAGKNFPLRMKTGYLETKDDRYVLVPLVVDFPSADAKATGRIIRWLGDGAKDGLPSRASLGTVEAALAAHGGRAFPLQITGAHAVAFWESQRLTKEILLSLSLSFLLIGIVYWIGFRTLSGFGYVVGPLLVGMVWALGLVGWSLGEMNMMSAGFGAVLLGIGDDVGILLFSRYRDERRAGRRKQAALRSAMLSTGPGVVVGCVATALAFLSAIVTPFPGFRDLGITAGLGLLACLFASFLLLPQLLLALDKGRGTFAQTSAPVVPQSRIAPWKPWLALGLLAFALLGTHRLRWEEDLRRFRIGGNPALALQEKLGKVLGSSLQPLALQLALDDAAQLPRRWNRVAEQVRSEGMPLPAWEQAAPGLRLVLSSETWRHRTLNAASAAGLDPTALEHPLAALSRSLVDPLAVPASLQQLFPPTQKAVLPQRWTLAGMLKSKTPAADIPTVTIPIRLPEEAQLRIAPLLEGDGARLVGTRPLFSAIKDVARQSTRDCAAVGLALVLCIVAFFGRRWRFVALALVPIAAGQIGLLGILAWTNEPFSFLSLMAIPISLGVSVDTALNLLHRARLESGAAAKVARVNAVCAGTTLAGFGGLIFSSYRGLRSLGIACVGGVALALLITQWVLPWLLEKWPLQKERL